MTSPRNVDKLLIKASHLKTEHIYLMGCLDHDLDGISPGDEIEIGIDTDCFPEWMWVRVENIKGRAVRGQLLSNPDFADEWKRGESLVFGKDKVLSVLQKH